MTKEQWLENMLSKSPLYEEFLNLKDKELILYIINNFYPEKPENSEAWDNFVINVMESTESDFLLTEAEHEFLKSMGE
jgi:dTDP-4-dehydrorhamnose 3,5-epimerase-like enzyme